VIQSINKFQGYFLLLTFTLLASCGGGGENTTTASQEQIVITVPRYFVPSFSQINFPWGAISIADFNNDQIDEVKNLAKEKYGGNIDEALIEFGVSEEKILDAKGEYLQMPIKKIDTRELSFDVLKYIPEDAALHYHFVPIEFKEGVCSIIGFDILY